MKILITGKGSYVGVNLKKYLENFGHNVVEVDTVTDEWSEVDYTSYDSVIHVAAIVHSDAKNATEELFQKVNTKLPFEIASLAKKNGVKHFVFISSMAVYSVGKTLDENKGIITKNTLPDSGGLYGGSKLAAEKILFKLQTDDFKVSFVRPPNIYGPSCRGNYIYLFKKLADLMFICPYVYTSVKQSMLYIDNLCELIRLILESNSNGVYLPQDDYIPNTVDIITTIRGISGKKTCYSKLCGYIIKLFSRLSFVKKLYGGIRYDEEASNCFDNKYQIVSFKEGMRLTYKDM